MTDAGAGDSPRAPLEPPAALFDLGGLRAVVTGASSGIGAQMATVLARAGASVVLVARRESQLRERAQHITDEGGQAVAVVADLVDRSMIPDTAAKCRSAFGDPDIVVHAAGINPRVPAEEVTDADWDQTLGLNLATPFFLSREFVPAMKARGWGRLITIASLQSNRAFPNGLPYGASKGGVAQLTRAMAQAWSGDGVMCNAIAPGFFPTELTAPVFNDPETEQWAASQTIVGRNGRLDDLTGITLFFASRASDYITGQILHIDGGFSAT